MVFTLLGEMRDVALTYGAAEPAARRRLAAEAEAALGRAGGALRPGVSPRLAWLGCFVLDGRWDEALGSSDDLPLTRQRPPATGSHRHAAILPATAAIRRPPGRRSAPSSRGTRH